MLALAMAAAAAVLAGESRAAEPSLLQACFPPQTLAARPSENKPKKVVAVAGAVAPARPALAPPQPSLRGAIRRVELPPGKKLIALTLDLCEQPGEIAGYDGAIFDYLRANGVKSTVFVGGKWLVTHPERARQLLADPLIELGNHGWSHRNVRGLSGAALAEEIDAPQRAYEAARAGLAVQACVAARPQAMSRVPERMRLYRFPYGACNAAALDAVAAQGLRAVQWDLSTGDPSPTQSAEAIARTTLRDVRPGSIIIAHANGRGYNTAAALPLLIPELRRRGFELVTVSELIDAGRPVATETCYDSRPGDTDKYDFLFGHRSLTGKSPHGWSTTTIPQ